MKRKILEVYLEEKENDDVSITFKNVAGTKEATDIMKMLILALNYFNN